MKRVLMSQFDKRIREIAVSRYGLHWLSQGTSTTNSEKELLFLHGFVGHITQTWGDFPRLLSNDKKWNTWALGFWGYRTSIFPRSLVPRWISDNLPVKRHVSLHDRANELVTVLRNMVRNNSSLRSIGLVGHSMGGLVILNAVRILHSTAVDSDEYLTILNMLAFIVLYGTPIQGSDRVTQFAARLHGELRDLHRFEPERKVMIDWLATYSQGKLLLLPAKESCAVISLAVLYSPSDAWVGPNDGRGPRPEFLGESLIVSHTELCKPNNSDDVRYSILCAARDLAEDPKGELKEIFRRIRNWNKIVNRLLGIEVQVNADTDVPAPVLNVFKDIVTTPVIEDTDHHYTSLTYRIQIDKNECRRITTRHGARVTPGATRFIEFEIGSGIPIGPND